METGFASVVVDVAVYLLGALALGAAVHAWRPEASKRVAGAYAVAVLAWFSPDLLTPRHPLATDIVYRQHPYRQTLDRVARPQHPIVSDPALRMLPWRALARRRLLSGEPPLWSHEMGSGQPLLGNAQSAPFAPLHLAALPLPPLRGLAVAAAWQALLALLLTHALLRRLGARNAGAALGALAFAFGGFAVVWRYYPLGMTATWLPGLLLGLVLLRRGERGGFLGSVACAAGMALSGQPELLAQSGLAAAAVVAVLLGLPGPGRMRFLVRAAGAGALAFCLSSPFLLPVMEAVAESDRLALVKARGGAASTRETFDGRYLMALVDPYVAGSTRERNWRGRGVIHQTLSAYAGVVPLALAVAGGLVRPRLLLALLAGLVPLLVAVGAEPFGSALDVVPWVGLAPRGRFRLFWALTVAVTAGLGLEALVRDRRGRWIGSGCLAAAGALLVAWRPPPGAPWLEVWWVAALAGLAAVLAALWLPGRERLLGRMALGAVVLDLALFGARFNPLLPARLDLRPPPEVGRLEALAEGAGRPVRILADGTGLRPDLPALYGLWDPRGFDPMRPAGTARFVRRGLPPRFQTWVRSAGDNPWRQPVLDALGVRFYLAHPDVEPPAPWRPVRAGDGGRIWENPEALPLFYVPERVEGVADERAALRRALSLEDFRAVALVEGEGEPRERQWGKVWVEEVSANGFGLLVRGSGGLVASGVSHAWPWRVLVDGRRVPARRVGGAFLGFEVPPGLRRVELRYLPAGWVAGMGSCAAALALLLALGLAPPRPAQ